MGEKEFRYHYIRKKIPYIIVLAKYDLIYEREIDEAEVEWFIDKYNCLYSFTSALNNKGLMNLSKK